MGVEHGSVANAGALGLNDFAPRHETKLEDIRLVGDKAETRGEPPVSIYLANASMGKRNKFFGAVYGAEHIAEREKSRDVLMWLHRKHEIIYKSEVLNMASDAMVRNFKDLVGGGIRRMLRVARMGIRVKSMAEYPLCREKMDHLIGPPPNSFDVHSKTGFRQSKFTPRLESKFANGIINNALGTGMAFSNSADDQPSFLPSGSLGNASSYPTPGLLSEEAIKPCFAHAPIKDDKRI